jgi:hypothetical protein
LRCFLAATMALVATGAQAYSTVSPRDNWSALSSAALQSYPPAVREALRAAQISCGGDEIRVRPGLVSYLKGPAGEEFVAVHFDKFYCLNDAALPRGACIAFLLQSMAARTGKFGEAKLTKSICLWARDRRR